MRTPLRAARLKSSLNMHMHPYTHAQRGGDKKCAFFFRFLDKKCVSFFSHLPCVCVQTVQWIGCIVCVLQGRTIGTAYKTLLTWFLPCSLAGPE